jgi:hypothetical protein
MPAFSIDEQEPEFDSVDETASELAQEERALDTPKRWPCWKCRPSPPRRKSRAEAPAFESVPEAAESDAECSPA